MKMERPVGMSSREDLIIAIAVIIVGVLVYIWQSRKIAQYEEKKQHMTKRINVVITKVEKKKMRYSYRFIYTFTGLDEYEGVTFYDKSLLLEHAHAEGEMVSLLINEYNVEEFWFEEEDEPGKGILVWMIVLIFVALMDIAHTIWDWDSLTW